MTQTLKEKTILVAEDREDDLELLKHMFKKFRVRNPIQVVDTVEKATAYLNGQGIYADRQTYPFPILLLVDLHLGDGGTGLNILRCVQSQKCHAPLGVVVLTGSNVKAIREAYSLGAHSFLIKPLRFEDFENMATRLRGMKLRSTGDGHELDFE